MLVERMRILQTRMREKPIESAGEGRPHGQLRVNCDCEYKTKIYTEPSESNVVPHVPSLRRRLNSTIQWHTSGTRVARRRFGQRRGRIRKVAGGTVLRYRRTRRTHGAARPQDSF